MKLRGWIRAGWPMLGGNTGTTRIQRNQSKSSYAFSQSPSSLTKKVVAPEPKNSTTAPAAKMSTKGGNMILRELRRAARLTQLELAVKTGISRVRLSQAECGYLKLSETECASVRLAIEQGLHDRADDLRNRLAVIGQGGAK